MRACFWTTFATVLLLLSGTALAQSGNIDVELNRLKQHDDACRASLVTQNLTDIDIETLQLDLVMFDNEGIIAKRLAVGLGPLPAGKTRLKEFDVADLACEDIGQLLLNDVFKCEDTEGSRENCLALLEATSRDEVPFIN